MIIQIIFPRFLSNQTYRKLKVRVFHNYEDKIEAETYPDEMASVVERNEKHNCKKSMRGIGLDLRVDAIEAEDLGCSEGLVGCMYVCLCSWFLRFVATSDPEIKTVESKYSKGHQIVSMCTV